MLNKYLYDCCTIQTPPYFEQAQWLQVTHVHGGTPRVSMRLSLHSSSKRRGTVAASASPTQRSAELASGKWTLQIRMRFPWCYVCTLRPRVPVCPLSRRRFPKQSDTSTAQLPAVSRKELQARPSVLPRVVPRPLLFGCAGRCRRKEICATACTESSRKQIAQCCAAVRSSPPNRGQGPQMSEKSTFPLLPHAVP